MTPYIRVVKLKDNSFKLIPIGQDMPKFSNQEIKDALKKALLWDQRKEEKNVRTTIKEKKKRSHNSKSSLN